LTAESKNPDTEISSFFYLLTSTSAVSKLVGRPAYQNSGKRGRPNKDSLLIYPPFGQKHDLVRAITGDQAIEDLARAEDGVLEDENGEYDE
jgi:hypothetical protein